MDLPVLRFVSPLSLQYNAASEANSDKQKVFFACPALQVIRAYKGRGSVGKEETDSQSTSSKAIREAVSTETDLIAALESLYQNKAQLLKLQQYATSRIAIIGRSAEGRAAQDLLNEAVTLTLEGRRIWNTRAVDLVGHLIGVMRSVSSHWAEEVSTRQAVTYSESDLTRLPPEGGEVNELHQQASTTPSPERVIMGNSEIRHLTDAFRDDSLVTEMLSGMRADMTGPEIQMALGITKSDYETGMKRLRRKVRTLAKENTHV